MKTLTDTRLLKKYGRFFMKDNSKMVIYFAHPVNTYNTELEKKLIVKIGQVFPSCFIENPNQGKHQKGYQKWKERTGNGMAYYFAEVLPFCDFGIYLPFRDGKWGTGVAGEAKFFVLRRNVPLVLTVNVHGDIRLIFFKSIRILSVEETRERILLPY